MIQRVFIVGLGLLAFGFNSRADDTNVARVRPTLFLIGDSTVKNSTKGQMGWGSPIANYFDTNRLAVVNLARGGRSSRTFLTEGLWDEVAAQLKPGDFVMMQFGHNDGGPMDEGRARASIHNNSDDSVVVTNKDSGTVETVYSYGWYLRRYIGDTKAKGATPVVLSPVARNRWKDGKVERARESYTLWAREAAKHGGAIFIDLNHLTATRYEQDGRKRTHTMYFATNDWTHTTPAGADVNAQCVVDGLRALHDGRLADYLLHHPPRSGLSEEPARPQLVVVIGDSTVANYPTNRADRGWGQFLQAQFTGNVVVSNLAANGRSSKTFIREGRWAGALKMQPDYVLIQFGHNDSHAPGKPESTDAATNFRIFLRQYVDEARDEGAVPIFVTPVMRRNFGEAGRLADTLQPYADAMKAVAEEMGVAVIDLHAASRVLYGTLGPEKVQSLASEAEDRTHFNEAGARAILELVVQELPRVAPKLATELVK